MLSLSNKKIILAISGGIAAYKSAILLRLLIQQGARVQVVMTESAKEFITPLTFQALSGEIVRSDLFDCDAEAGMGHIELAQWADLVIIAPATANTIAKISHGFADNLLTTLCLATQAPLLIAPAMNKNMWHHFTTQENINKLSTRESIFFCGPAQGQQACGDIGHGRMEEPELILQACIDCFTDAPDAPDAIDQARQELNGLCVMVTAGPTIEDIDPVRYLTNRSSGKMGYAIAQAAIDAGARVILISGPVNLDSPYGAEVHQVRSAQQMQEYVFKMIELADIFISTAAVADYRPIQISAQKIKKNCDHITIEMIKTPDILSAVAALEKKPMLIGFAAETNNLQVYAIDKLKRKKLDMIVANQVGDGKGFDTDENELFLFLSTGEGITSKNLPFASKTILAQQLIAEIAVNFKYFKDVKTL